MTIFWKRAVCLLLTVAVLLCATGCSMIEDLFGPKTYLEELKDAFDQDADREDLEYETEYIQQHLTYIRSGEYIDTTFVTGGLPTLIAEHYDGAQLDLVNGFWELISGGSKVLAQGELELENEYEVLVAELMQSTGADANFASGFEKGYYDAFVSLFRGIHEYLSIMKDSGDFFSGDDLEDLEEFLDYLDDLLEEIEDMDGLSSDDASSLFGDAFEEVKDELDRTYLKDNAEFLDGFKESMGIAADVSSLASESVEDVMDAYLFYSAMENASDEWENVWENIASEAEDSETDEGEKIAACINKLLDELRDYRSDSAEAMVKSGVSCAGKNLGEFAYEQGYSLIEDTFMKHPMIQMIRSGVIGGVALANLLVNSDDIAYYGQMLMGYGAISEYSFNVMRDKEDRLVSREDFDGAVMFDAAFHVYKAIQISAADCAISYCQAIITANAGKWFPGSTEDEVRDVEGLLEHKAMWSRRECHGGAEVLNNGGIFVGYRGNVYYLRRQSGFMGTTGTFGSFSKDYSLAADLVSRKADGTETVLLSGGFSDGIYICGSKIALRSPDGFVFTANLDGSDLQQHCKGSVVDDIPDEELLLLWDENSQSYLATDLNGYSYTVLEGEANALEVKYNSFYYYTLSNDVYSFRYYHFDTGENAAIGNIDTGANVDPYWYGSAQAIYIATDGIYMQMGWHAGTGFFYQGGSIFYLSMATGETTTLVSMDVSVPMFNLIQEDEQSAIVYNTVSMYSDTGPYIAAHTTDNTWMDLATGSTSASGFPICEVGQVFVHQGGLWVYTDYTSQPMLLMNVATAASFDCAGFGEQENGSILRAEDVSILGGLAYVTLTYMERDASADIGWRSGYGRVFTEVYCVDPYTQEMELICSY